MIKDIKNMKRIISALIAISTLFLSGTAGAVAGNEATHLSTHLSTPSAQQIAEDKIADILVRSEKAGGHLLARHVGKTTADLKARLIKEPSIAAASTFISVAEAKMAVGKALQSNASRISAWVSNGARGRLALNAPFSCGAVLIRGATVSMKGTGVRIILQGDGRGGLYILTGFPTR